MTFERMNRIGIILLFLGVMLTAGANAQDTTARVKRVYPVKVSSATTNPNRFTTATEIRLSIYGEYKISGYTAMNNKAQDEAELNLLIGSFVRVDSTAITGDQIDPITFVVYQVDRLQKDDYLYRVFGTDLKTTVTDLPASFNVHKTDNERCYGIAETGDGRIAIPYNGALLYLVRTNQ